MSGATDSGMVKTMGVVMACLGVLAVVCVLAARMLGIGSEDYADPMKRKRTYPAYTADGHCAYLGRGH